MKAVVYSSTGPASQVLRLVERDVPEPGPGEVRVKVAFSGVNPIDSMLRRDGVPSFAEVVPHHDGSGVVDAVGSGVERLRLGQRVWLREAAFRRPGGTAQEYTVVPAHLATVLPDGVSLETGAAIGIPAMTAHRALTVHEDAPPRLGPDVLSGATVLVAGGTGAVCHASIQLARWAGAQVVATVRTDMKGDLARAAGAHHVVNRHTADTAAAIRDLAPDGVDVIVEMAPVANASLNAAVARNHGCVAVYADLGSDGGDLALPVGRHMFCATSS
ncbi:NADPH:quinone reductase [Streptomyces sp. NPDC002133]|uniref:NADPH:quinone reductase n=1 Tax=Streptomyces sp. NPDC002133 TaxID=3154409 RepID=UPI003331EAFF